MYSVLAFNCSLFWLVNMCYALKERTTGKVLDTILKEADSDVKALKFFTEWVYDAVCHYDWYYTNLRQPLMWLITIGLTHEHLQLWADVYGKTGKAGRFTVKKIKE